MIVCKNCTYEYEANFCPSCGQKASVRRFSTRILFADLVDKILPLDRGGHFYHTAIIHPPGRDVARVLRGQTGWVHKTATVLIGRRGDLLGFLFLR